MKTKFLSLLLLGAFILPVMSGLFDLEAGRRRASVVVISNFVEDPQTVVSPN